VRSTQAIEIFGSVSTPFGSVLSFDYQAKFNGDAPGEPLRGGEVKRKTGMQI